MKKYLFVLVGLLAFACSSTPNSKIEEKRDIKDVEIDLLELIHNYESSIIEGNDENAVFFKKHLSPAYKAYLSQEMKIENIDSVLIAIYEMSHGMMEKLKAKKGVKIKNEVVGIKEHLNNGDTLIYLVQNDMIMYSEKKNKKLTVTDYVLAISNNYGKDWYFFQPDLPSIKDLINDQLDDETTINVVNFLKHYKPSEKVTDLK